MRCYKCSFWCEVRKVFHVRILNMDLINEINQSSVNIDCGETVEMAIIKTAVTVIDSDNISVRMSSALEELNRNMTMAVLPVTVFIGIEAFIGLFGNILILMIYSKKYERSNFRYFVLSMAVIDLTSCCTTLPGEIFSQMNWYDYQHGWICKVKSYFNVLTAWGSASILLLMACDRYRKVCKPLAWQIQPSFALRLCFASGVVSAIVAAPISVLWGKQTYVLKHDDQNITVSICEKSGQYANAIYPLVYICCVYIIPVGLMVIVVCFLNFLTAKSLFGRNSSIFLSKQKPFAASRSAISTSIETDLESRCAFNQNHVASSRSTIATIVDTDFESGIIFTSNNNLCDASNVDEVKESANSNMDDGDKNIWTIDLTNGDSKDSQSNICPVMSNQVINKDTSDGILFNIDHNTEMAKTEMADFKFCEMDNKGIIKGKLAKYDSENGIKCSSASCKKHTTSHCNDTRKKRKTVIMLILTSYFLITMLTYVILITLVAGKDGILKNSKNSEKVIFFFFWRLYFSNTIVNPLLYGFLDPRFRSGLRSLLKCERFRGKKKQSNMLGFRPRNRRPVFTLQCR